MAVASTIFFVSCVSYAFAVDGGWSKWSQWSFCSVTCGQGTKYRFRNCDSPPPTQGGKFCRGLALQREECANVANCPVDGVWTEWSPWSACSVSCGIGAERRFRSCNNPKPQFGGQDCFGVPQESRDCALVPECARDGQWSSWSVWSSCSATCGSGTRVRYRACNSPPPSGGGKNCIGPRRRSESCLAPIGCPVNGQWSRWSDWSPCVVTCGPGKVQRRRACNNPPPQHGGLPCPGASSEANDCAAEIECPVNGGWSDWGPYGACVSLNCLSNISYTFRQRSCNSPIPAFEGEMCQGNFLMGGLCVSPVNCPVDGGWSDWSVWNCSENTAERTRRCDNPPPSNGGRPCPPLGFVERYASDLDDVQYDNICRKKQKKNNEVLKVPLDDEDVEGDEGEGGDEGEEDEEEEFDFGI